MQVKAMVEYKLDPYWLEHVTRDLAKALGRARVLEAQLTSGTISLADAATAQGRLDDELEHCADYLGYGFRVKNVDEIDDLDDDPDTFFDDELPPPPPPSLNFDSELPVLDDDDDDPGA